MTDVQAIKKARRSSAAVTAQTVSAPPEVKRKAEMMAAMRFTFVGVLLLLIILTLVDVIPIADTLTDTLVQKIRDMGAAGGVLYCFCCAAFAIICMPSSLLALAAGYTYESTWKGFLAAHPGILLGAVISFFLGRTLFKEWLENEMRGVMKFDALSTATKDKGHMVVLFGRLSPIPFGLINYALSVSQITYAQFIGASFVGLLPITILYAKVGADFYTYFETSEVQAEYDKCNAAVPLCCSGTNSTLDCASITSASMITTELIACLASKGCDFKTLEKEAEDLNCQYNNCEGSDALKKGNANDECAALEVLQTANYTDVDNGSCLRSLNEAVLWPKIVLPLMLFITLGIMGYFGKRALERGNYLQVQYEMDRQKELLMAEKEAQASVEATV